MAGTLAAARGVRAATARLLASKGAHVVVADLNEEQGTALAAEIGGSFSKCNVASEEDGIAAVEAAKAAAPLWSLVNSAGIGWVGRTIGKDGEYASAHPLESYRKVLEVNLVGSFNMARLAATAMSHNTVSPILYRGCRVYL